MYFWGYVLLRNFGEELSQIRKKRMLSIDDVARITKYSTKRIRELEKDNGLPSLDLLNQLSSCYKANLSVYFSSMECSLSHFVIEAYYEFKVAIENFDAKQLSILINKYENEDYFQEGKGLILILYSKGLCSYKLKNYSKAFYYCKKALDIDNINLYSIRDDYIYYSYVILSVLVTVAELMFYTNNNLAIKLAEDLKYAFDNVYFYDDSLIRYNTEFITRLLLINSNNLAKNYLGAKKFDEAIQIIDDTINFCQNRYKASLLVVLYMTKLSIVYEMCDFRQAKVIVSHILLTFSLSDNEKKYNLYNERLANLYPSLFDN